MLFNDADYAPFNLHGGGVFMNSIPAGIYRKQWDYVVLLKAQVQIPTEILDCWTEGLEVLQVKSKFRIGGNKG